MILIRCVVLLALINISCSTEVNPKIADKTDGTSSDFFFVKNEIEVYLPISKKKDLSKKVLDQVIKEINPQNHLMVPINRNEERRLSVFECNLENAAWKVDLSFSEHQKKYIHLIQKEISKTIQSDSLINALQIDFIQFPVSFYEKDQLEVLD
jgi:hypothetical protein